MDVDSIREEFKRFAPGYAQEEAEAALDKIIELQSQGLVRSGLYYVVLSDLIGSTKYMAEFGNPAAAKRVEHFVTSSLRAIGETPLTNTAIFIKELGDAVLLLFQCFSDVLKWHSRFEGWLRLYKPDEPAHEIRIRTCVHIGDVILQGVNPIALAVSQLFKFEKDVPDGEIVLSEPAYSVAWPTLARAYHAFESLKKVDLDGYPDPVMLHRLRRETVEKLDDFVSEASLD